MFSSSFDMKLKSAIDSFDRILDEYSGHTSLKTEAEKKKTAPHPAGHPPLQRAKTCSIIESQCILKKVTCTQDLYKSLELIPTKLEKSSGRSAEKSAQKSAGKPSSGGKLSGNIFIHRDKDRSIGVMEIPPVPRKISSLGTSGLGTPPRSRIPRAFSVSDVSILGGQKKLSKIPVKNSLYSSTNAVNIINHGSSPGLRQRDRPGSAGSVQNLTYKRSISAASCSDLRLSIPRNREFEERISRRQQVPVGPEKSPRAVRSGITTPPIAKPRNLRVVTTKLVGNKTEKVSNDRNMKITSMVQKFDRTAPSTQKKEGKLDDCIVSCNELIEKINQITGNKQKSTFSACPQVKTKMTVLSTSNKVAPIGDPSNYATFTRTPKIKQFIKTFENHQVHPVSVTNPQNLPKLPSKMNLMVGNLGDVKGKVGNTVSSVGNISKNVGYVGNMANNIGNTLKTVGTIGNITNAVGNTEKNVDIIGNITNNVGYTSKSIGNTAKNIGNVGNSTNNVGNAPKNVGNSVTTMSNTVTNIGNPPKIVGNMVTNIGNTFGERKKLRTTKFTTTPKQSPMVLRDVKLAAIKDQVQSARDIVETLKSPPPRQEVIASAVKSEVIAKRPFAKSDSGIALNDGEDFDKYRTLTLSKAKMADTVKSDHDDDDSDDSGHLSNDPDPEQEQEKIFFRSGVLSELEHQRDERMAGMVVSLQAHCRGYLARKRLAKRKLEDLAVRCLQRNVRKFISVRDWPWWRLLVRVTPLLNVHRTEEELKLKSEELAELRVKLERIEADRVHLKHENDKLESKLSEITVDLAEEHSTATLATERLDAETAERVRVERELSETAHKNKELTQQTERLEMELLYARSDLNGIDEEDEDADGDGIYRQRYERTVRELEFTKRRLQQQHEDDLEQLVGLKKQLEKKLTDAFEEVEEQRQVVGQWKRKVAKLNGEMSDVKHLLEEQNARNNLLEKKQRKFDAESQLAHDEVRGERQAKERLGREKELLAAEKFALDAQLQDVRMELETREERCAALQRELDEVAYGGKTEEEVAALRKQKQECERRLHDQEEELDEMAGQVQLLEQAKLKLEMSLEQMRKQGKKEAAAHDEELEEVRCSAQKKVKALEAQLENEHEERTILLREKHELERRLVAAMENTSEKACDEALLLRLKRDLKRTKVLLRDTQTQLERQKNENPGKNIIRQLRNQIDDLECARSLAAKARTTVEAELSETQSLLDDASKAKQEAEEKLNAQMRERNDLQAQLEENEEELAEVLKKYKASVAQLSLDQLALQEQVSAVCELEVERNGLREQLAELTSKLESVESLGDASSHVLVKRAELKVKELESKLELEQTTKQRQEVQVVRLKEAVDKLQSEVATARAKEQAAQDQIRKLQRNVRELRDEHNLALSREGEALLKRKELEKRCETLEGEAATARTDLRLALKRIEDLQSAIQGELDDDSIDNSDSYSSDDSVNTFLAIHKSTSPTQNCSSSASARKLSSGSGGKDGYA